MRISCSLLSFGLFYVLSDPVEEALSHQTIAKRNSSRNLQSTLEGRRKGRGGKGGKGGKSKSQKLSTLINILTSEALPQGFSPSEWSKPHRPNAKHAILAVGMDTEMMPLAVKYFCGTARKYGYDGDIVVGIEPGTRDTVIEYLKTYESTVYVVDLKCELEEDLNRKCSLYNTKNKYSINVIRYYLYRWWAQLYEPDTLIMISDFRDVFFQANPFTYRPFEWAPPAAQLVVFQEAHPNVVINRCPFNSNWIRRCYGDEAYNKVAHNTVSCSGVTMGTRNAIIAYAYIITQHTDPKIRKGPDTPNSDNDNCLSLGVDQGFHNWIVYSGVLDKYMDVRIFQQGEGPVNTVGGFSGKSKILTFSLEEWGILKGAHPNAYIANWNGDRSPVVHQLDRFLHTTTFNSDYRSVLDAVQGFPLT